MPRGTAVKELPLTTAHAIPLVILSRRLHDQRPELGALSPPDERLPGGCVGELHPGNEG